jgi:hypothetical protein
MATASSNILDELLDSLAHCFTPAVAEEVVNLQYDAQVQGKLQELRTKANEGSLSDSEREEYVAFVEAVDFIAILQAKSRQILQEKAAN